MIYQVQLQPAAVEDLDAAYQYPAQHAQKPAVKWLGRSMAALQTLERSCCARTG